MLGLAKTAGSTETVEEIVSRILKRWLQECQTTGAPFWTPDVQKALEEMDGQAKEAQDHPSTPVERYAYMMEMLRNALRLITRRIASLRREMGIPLNTLNASGQFGVFSFQGKAGVVVFQMVDKEVQLWRFVLDRATGRPVGREEAEDLLNREELLHAITVGFDTYCSLVSDLQNNNEYTEAARVAGMIERIAKEKTPTPTLELLRTFRTAKEAGEELHSLEEVMHVASYASSRPNEGEPSLPVHAQSAEELFSHSSFLNKAWK